MLFAEHSCWLNQHLVDATSIEAVIQGLSEICGAKAEHIAHNWQDTILAKRLATMEGALGVASTKATGLGGLSLAASLSSLATKSTKPWHGERLAKPPLRRSVGLTTLVVLPLTKPPPHKQTLHCLMQAPQAAPNWRAVGELEGPQFGRMGLHFRGHHYRCQ